MPEISRFLGIVIRMFYDEHNPPHFHAEYAEHKASIKIDNFALLEGYLPPKIHGLVVEWASIHRQELLEDWNLAEKNQPLMKIKPLE